MPGFSPRFPPAEMLAMGVFEGKYGNDCRGELPGEWFAKGRVSEPPDPAFNFFWGQEPKTAFLLERERLDHRSRSEGLVPLLLSLLPGPATTGNRRLAGQAMEQLCVARRTNSRQSCARGYLLPAKTAAGTSAMVALSLHLSTCPALRETTFDAKDGSSLTASQCPVMAISRSRCLSGLTTAQQHPANTSSGTLPCRTLVRTPLRRRLRKAGRTLEWRILGGTACRHGARM